MTFDTDLKRQFGERLETLIRDFVPGISEAQQQQLLDYLALLIKWNKAYNLTAVRDPEEMLQRHLVDSLSIAPHVDGPRILDVGTGAGLPGIPLAICLPDREFTLLDSNSKKTRFLIQCCIELGLKNVEVVHARIETAEFDAGFDQIVSRAFSTLERFVHGAEHLLAEKGELLAMKGAYPEEEIQELPESFTLKTAIELQLPACEAQRHLIIINRSSSQ